MPLGISELIFRELSDTHVVRRIPVTTWRCPRFSVWRCV